MFAKWCQLFRYFAIALNIPQYITFLLNSTYYLDYAPILQEMTCYYCYNRPVEGEGEGRGGHLPPHNFGSLKFSLIKPIKK